MDTSEFITKASEKRFARIIFTRFSEDIHQLNAR